MSAELPVPREYTPLGLADWFDALPARTRADLRWSGPRLRGVVQRVRSEPITSTLLYEAALEWAIASQQTTMLLVELPALAPIIQQLGLMLGEAADRIGDAHPDARQLFDATSTLLGRAIPPVATTLADPAAVEFMRSAALVDALRFNPMGLPYFTATLCLFAADGPDVLDDDRVMALGRVALANALVVANTMRPLSAGDAPAGASLTEFLLAATDTALSHPGNAALELLVARRPALAAPAVRRDVSVVRGVRWTNDGKASVTIERGMASIELRADAELALAALASRAAPVSITWLDEGDGGRLLRLDESSAAPQGVRHDTERMLSDWSELLARLAR